MSNSKDDEKAIKKLTLFGCEKAMGTTRNYNVRSFAEANNFEN